jgi:hypothetical protein
MLGGEAVQLRQPQAGVAWSVAKPFSLRVSSPAGADGADFDNAAT